MTIDHLIAAARAARPADCFDSKGVARRNPERAAFYDAVYAWKEGGRDPAGLKALKAREATLRREGKF